MILYFADRQLNILGQASTNLPKGIIAINDLKTEDVETGINIFECDILFDKKTRLQAEAFTEVGNYLLRSNDDEQEFYTILDCEIDTKKQKIYIYAEDGGLDLINEVVGSYDADQYYPISHYVNKYAEGSGWEIGINEIEGLTRKLSFSGEETTSARLLNIAKEFNNCELSFSFKISGLHIIKKYINIYEKRGTDTGIPLRLNKEIDSIVTTKSITNLATALSATGGTPDGADDAITLLGYEYDDGDFYVDGAVLKSRKAFAKWQRVLKGDQDGGHIVKPYSDNSLSQEILCANAIEELKLISDMEINYEADIKKFPKNVKPGDRVNIIDDAGNLYLSSRLLTIETSVTDRTRRAVLGEHLIKKDGISSKVEKLAADFAKSTKSVERAKEIASNAKDLADEAKQKAENALKEAQNAAGAVDGAVNAANDATQAANNAAAAALAAEAAVNKVEESVQGIVTTVENAQQAAQNAYSAAETATQKAEEAKTAAQNAEGKIDEAKAAAEEAKAAAEQVTPIATEAMNTANGAKEKADNAAAIARAAKIDAEQAEKDIEALGDKLETQSQEMQANYSRKTDLTETEAELKTKIAQNAAKIETTAHSVVRIDETANNAFGLAQQAQAEAVAAQQLADEASAYALEAQQAAAAATQAADDAQNEADTARTAAETARTVADTAKADLEAAKADLETVALRADATEEEIETAKAAVTAAQNVVDIAKAEAAQAETIAINAQNTADKAAAKALEAETEATAAVNAATIAQQNANNAKGNAAAAQAEADAAMQTAIDAQETATEAKAVADAAQKEAENAVLNATKAAEVAEASATLSEQAATDLATAEQTLTNILADVNATEEQVIEAQSAVEIAQIKATEAENAAVAAQNAADEAAEYAITAQIEATTAQEEAAAAQLAAEEAMQAVETALGEVGKLEVKTIVSDTKITQTASSIKLAATKQEVKESLAGVYTKTETDAKIEVKGDEISSTVSANKTLADGRMTAAESEIKQLANIIANLITDGNGTSLMTQTADGWTFSTSDIQKSVNSTSDSLAELVKNCETTDEVVAVLQAAVADIGAKTEYVTITTYTYTNDAGSTVTEPCIQLGETDSDYKLLITNTQILFKVGSATPTRINTDGLVTENITVENELRQSNPETTGYYFWSVRANGNYGLQWKEG